MNAIEAAGSPRRPVPAGESATTMEAPATPGRDVGHPAPRSADGIAELFRGAIRTGQLGDGERLPTVRQTARDFDVAQATAAKVYRSLEQEGLVITRTAAGTRVAPGASRAPGEVVARARALVEAAQESGVDLDETVGVLRALWAETNG